MKATLKDNVQGELICICAGCDAMKTYPGTIEGALAESDADGWVCVSGTYYCGDCAEEHLRSVYGSHVEKKS